MSSSIPFATPMRAYDHIADLLKKDGAGDGIVSKEDAEKLVADLRNEGNGTEALAAENVFKMLDAFNAQPGQSVTGYDFTAARRFVESKMLNNDAGDAKVGGFSDRDAARMSATGRAFIEIGKLLELPGKGRTSPATPEKGLDHVAALVKNAAGDDGIISRANIRLLASQLNKMGRGTEALATGYLFRMTDVGAGVTASDIDVSVDFAKEQMLNNDGNNNGDIEAEVKNNGDIEAEVKNFSTSAKAFLMVGQMLENGIL